MPKRPIVATLLTVAALALLLSFKTPETVGLASTGGGGVTGGVTGGGVTGGTLNASYSGQVTGQVAQTPFGNVQVQVTIQSGKITDVQALQLPSGGGHTGQVSAYAGPQLRSEVLAAQSANVNTISGATYTSIGYLQSLQSALDQA